MEPLTREHFARAAKDPSFRRFLIEAYGLKDADLPPLVAGAQQEIDGEPSFADVTGGGSTTAPSRPTTRIGPRGIPIPVRQEGDATVEHSLGVGARGAVKGAGDLAAVVLTGLGPLNSYRQNQEVMNRLTGTMAGPLPEAATSGERVWQSATRGMASTGGLGGVAGVLSGGSAGATSQVAAEAGMGPGGQLVAGLVGGLAPAGIARLAARFSVPARAEQIIRRTQLADDLPPTVPDQPTPKVERSLALRVAGQGGAPADRLAQRASETLADYTTRKRAATDAARTAIQRARDEGSAMNRTLTDAVRSTRMRGQDEIARLKEVERVTRIGRQQQAERMIGEAMTGATGDQVADALVRHAAVPKQTVQQMLTTAEADLSTVGRKVFGRLDDLELTPGPEGQAVFEALNDPQVGGLIREAYNTYAPRIEHAPRFQELQKAYQLLGAKARAAAKNGGALPGGELMPDLYAARDALGTAMEQAFPSFREANAAYRAQASLADAIHEGPLLAAKGKAADIADRMAALEQSGGTAAVAALRQSMGRAMVDRLRETPVTRDMATRMAAGGSDEIARLQTLFPDEASFRTFADDIQEATNRVVRARQAGEAGVQSVTPEFAGRRMAVRGELREQVQQMTKDVRAQQDVTQRRVRTLQQQGRESLRGLQSEDVRTAREIEQAARRLDIPESGRPLKGAVELGAGARARGIVDVVYGLFGKRSDPKDVRALLADYLLAPPEQRQRLAASLRDVGGRKRSLLPTGAMVGAYTSDTPEEP